MNLQAIESFLKIIETGSLTKAADELYIAQSTVSHRIKALEQELNTILIVREKGHKTITLTRKGEEFVSIAQRWLALWKDTLDLQNQEPHLSLSIGCVDSLNTYIFPSLYKQLLNHQIPIDLQIRTHQSLEIYHLLENREIDVGFVLREMSHKYIIAEPLFTEKMVLICRKNNDAAEKAYHPNELDPKYELFLNWSPKYQEWHDFHWDSSKRPLAHVDTASLILSLMDDSKNWAIVPISMGNAFKNITDIQIHDILDPPPERVCYKLTHKYSKSSSKSSIEILNEYLHSFTINTFNILS